MVRVARIHLFKVLNSRYLDVPDMYSANDRGRLTTSTNRYIHGIRVIRLSKIVLPKYYI